MSPVPLEDQHLDIINKAQRGRDISDHDLATRAGISTTDMEQLRRGEIDPQLLTKIAKPLGLGISALIESAQKTWQPKRVALDGLRQFYTFYRDMSVNAYLVWDTQRKVASVFDTGGSSSDLLDFAAASGIKIELVLLTHAHEDHVADLSHLLARTGAVAWINVLEAFEGVRTFQEGQSFRVGGLSIETRLTCGHSVGGTTYLVHGLSRPLAIVGDAIFAGSMGGGKHSYNDALDTNRTQILSLPDETVLAPGHGPLTTVAEEKRHNPFFTH